MPDSSRMPVLFVGHGSPMNAIEDNQWSRAFKSLATLLPTPRAILSISAHWFVPGTYLTGNQHPETIHDFGGFPQTLYEMKYPAAGDVDLAGRVVKLIGTKQASLSYDWGIDHGTWSVLHHLYPEADHPVVQLSINTRGGPADHLAIGRALSPLRDEGVLIMGSGNIVHNLWHAMLSFERHDLSTPDWANSFDTDIARAVEQYDADFLVGALDTKSGHISHPTPDHYMPLLYAFGASDKSDRVTFPITGFDLSSLSMRAIIFA